MTIEIPGYEILEKIGEGGSATVWKARQLSLDRVVAIKWLGTSSLPDQEARDRFRKEAQVTARLSHPGIVQVIDTGEIGEAAYLVLEYVDGPTVGDLIRDKGLIAEPRALEITAAVARALAYAWEKECLIHCDIKPDNILIDRLSGAIKVADLGVARMIGPRQVDGDFIIGTANYIAPEQSEGLPDLDCRVDMYALAATLYHMTTGVMPFRDAPGNSAMLCHERDYLEDPITLNPDLTAATAWLMEKWMVKNRALRPHFWTDAVRDLEAARRGEYPAPPLPEPGASTVRRAAERSAVRPVKPRAVAVPRPDAPAQKLTLKKSDLDRTASAPVRKRGSGLAAVRNLFLLLLLAGGTYAYLIHVGLLSMPALPGLAPREAEPVVAEPSTEPEWKDAEVEPAAEPERPGVWRNEDFLAGARLFNQALADYNEFQKTRANPGILTAIEENCREAIAHFEACRADAPAHIDIGLYIDQCYGLISNARYASRLGLGDGAAPAAGSGAANATAEEDRIEIILHDPKPGSRAATPAPSRNVVFVDDEVVAEPAPAEPEPVNLLRISIAAGWDRPTTVSAFDDELRRLLVRHATPTAESAVDPSAVLYPGITAMMPARDAARGLGQELPVRRAVETPGFFANGFLIYRLTGEFSGAAELALIVDQNDRVVAVQLADAKDNPARLEPALFSENWSVIDFIGARRRLSGDGLIAHRVRSRGAVVRLDTELASTGDSRTASARFAVMMPVQLAGMILQATSPAR
jgi:serine/threonine-protein kinase